MLAHHREIGLNCEQVMALLDLNREYHSRQVAIQLEFAQTGESLEIKWGRINNQEIAKRENLLKRHAQLFEEHERLFFEMARRGHEILTDEQLERAEAVYHEAC
jgi:predicted DNA-binding WGR domain protein